MPAFPESIWLERIEKAPPGVLVAVGGASGAAWFLVRVIFCSFSLENLS